MEEVVVNNPFHVAATSQTYTGYRVYDFFLSEWFATVY